MMYTRASASDYDDFRTPGWTTKELLPLMRKVECLDPILSELLLTYAAA